MVKGVHHIGLSVRTLDESVAFYRDHFGLDVKYRAIFQGDPYETIMGLTGVRGEVAVLRAEGVQLELFEFETPEPATSDPMKPVSDHGISHLCLEVADIEDAYTRLSSAGVSFHCRPFNPFGSAKATYARDPDGNIIELLEFTEAP